MRRAWMVVGVLGVAGEAGAQALTLEYLGVGGYYADINDRGQVVMRGWDGQAERVARYTDGVGLQFFGGGTGTGIFRTRIGDSGQVSWWDGIQPFRFTDGVGVESLNTTGTAYALASGINGSGEVVGQSVPNLGPTIAWRYGTEHQMIPIVPSGASPGMTYAAAINNAGQIVGQWEAPLQDAHAVRYTPGLGVQDLGTFGGLGSSADGINERGDMFGWWKDLSGHTFDAIFPDSGGMVNLGVSPGHMILYDMNDLGWIAARDTSVYHAVVWTRETGFVDLNTLLPAGSNAELFEAFGVNNHGQLAVQGTVNGQYGMYRVTVHQLPGPGSMLPLIGGLALSWRRRRGVGRILGTM